MKFQILLEATNKKTATMANDEFERQVRLLFDASSGFRLLNARSLDNVRPEVYEPSKPDEVYKQTKKENLKSYGRRKSLEPKDILDD